MLSFKIGGNADEQLALIAKIPAALDRAIETALDKSAAAILNRIRTTYLAEQDPTGAPWVPSAAGRARRARGGTGTMFDTGNLFRSIQLAPSTTGERAIQSDVEYGPKMQLGLFGNVPRPFMAVTAAHEKLFISIVEFEVNKAIKGLV